MIKKQPYFIWALLIELILFIASGVSNVHLGASFVLLFLAFGFVYIVYLVIFLFKLIFGKKDNKKEINNKEPKVSHSTTTNDIVNEKALSKKASNNNSAVVNNQRNVSVSTNARIGLRPKNNSAAKESPSPSHIQYGVKITPNGLSTVNTLKTHPKKQNNTNLTIHHLRRKLFNFVVVDCETTGLSRNSKIIQLSAIRYFHDKPVDTFDEFINPGVSIPSNVTALTGIDDTTVSQSPEFSVIVNDFASFVGTLPWVGHNINSFDIPLLINNGYPLKEIQTIDTLPLARKKLNMDSYGLESLKKYFGIQNGSHNALEDCKTTAVVYQHLRDDVLIPVTPDYSSIPQTLAGKQFAISGSFPGYSRADIKEIIISHGGVVKGVSHKTDYLIDGTQTSNALTDGIHSSKELKARDYGIKFLSLNEFIKMVKNN